MENEAKTVEVAGVSILLGHILDVDDLGSHIARSAASNVEILWTVAELGEPQVADDDFVTPIGVLDSLLVVLELRNPEEQIVRLEIPMHDVVRVQSLEPFQKTPHDVDGLLLRKQVLLLTYYKKLR